MEKRDTRIRGRRKEASKVVTHRHEGVGPTDDRNGGLSQAWPPTRTKKHLESWWDLFILVESSNFSRPNHYHRPSSTPRPCHPLSSCEAKICFMFSLSTRLSPGAFVFISMYKRLRMSVRLQRKMLSLNSDIVATSSSPIANRRGRIIRPSPSTHHSLLLFHFYRSHFGQRSSTRKWRKRIKIKNEKRKNNEFRLFRAHSTLFVPSNKEKRGRKHDKLLFLSLMPCSWARW